MNQSSYNDISSTAPEETVKYNQNTVFTRRIISDFTSENHTDHNTYNKKSP